MEKSLQAMQKARAAQMARKSAQASAESGKAVLQVTGKGSKLSVQGITAAIQKGVVALEKMGKWIAAGGSAFLLVFILIVGIIAGAAFSSNSESSESLSACVYFCDTAVCIPIRHSGICVCDTGHHDAGIWRQGNRPDAVFGKSI